MTQLRLISRQYRGGPDAAGAEFAPNCSFPVTNICLVGDPNPSFHRIDACSPGCDDAPTIDPDDCNAFGLAPGNIYCFPAHIGQVNVADQDDDNVNEVLLNRVTHFGDRYYGWLDGHIWEFNWLAENALFVGAAPTGSASGSPGGLATWTVAASPGGTADSNTNNRALGLYSMMISGIPFVVTAVQETATSWKSVRLNGNTGMWESGVVVDGFTDWTASNGSIHCEIRYRNSIYFITSERAEIKVYEPENQRFSAISLPANIRFPIDMCVFHDRLFLLCKNSDGDVILYEVFPSGIGEVFTLISSNLSGTDNREGRNALFVDNRFSSTPRMYCCNYINSTVGGNPGFESWEIELVNGVLVNNGRIQGIAGAMPLGVDGPNPSLTEDILYRVFNDSLIVPLAGGQPLIEIRSEGGNGALYQSFIWDGPNTPSAQWGGLGAHFILSYAHERGPDIGSRVGYFDSPDIMINSISDVSSSTGNVIINYNIITNFSEYPNGTPMSVRFLYGTDGHAHKSVATISNPNVGTITSDNRHLITANSGTSYEVEWNFRDDGFEFYDQAYFLGHVSTTGVT